MVTSAYGRIFRSSFMRLDDRTNETESRETLDGALKL